MLSWTKPLYIRNKPANGRIVAVIFSGRILSFRADHLAYSNCCGVNDQIPTLSLYKSKAEDCSVRCKWLQTVPPNPVLIVAWLARLTLLSCVDGCPAEVALYP